MSGLGVDVFAVDNSFAGGGGGGFSANYGQGLFADGLDGNATIIGTTTLTKEMHYNSLTIGATGVLKPAGFRIFVKDTLIIDAGGTINDDGAAPLPGTPSVGGLGLVSRQTLGGAAGAGGNGASGGNGSVGGGPGGNSSLNDVGLAPIGGAGGAGGANGGGNPGAAAQPIQGQRWHSTTWQQQARFSNGTATAAFNGGSGGGGGGSSAATCTGGGGGGGAGSVWIAAKTVINNGRISANAGNGANGSGTAGDAGGGGGGGGGNVCVGTLSYTGGGVLQALAGVGGNGFNNGVKGNDGRAGSTLLVVLS